PRPAGGGGAGGIASFILLPEQTFSPLRPLAQTPLPSSRCPARQNRAGSRPRGHVGKRSRLPGKGTTMRKSLLVLAIAALAASTAMTPALAQTRSDVKVGLVLEPPSLDPTAEAAAAVDEVV